MVCILSCLGLNDVVCTPCLGMNGVVSILSCLGLNGVVCIHSCLGLNGVVCILSCLGLSGVVCRALRVGHFADKFEFGSGRGEICFSKIAFLIFRFNIKKRRSFQKPN